MAASDSRKRKRVPESDAAVSNQSGVAAARDALVELLRRIRANHSVHLSSQNKTAQAALYGVLLEDIRDTSDNMTGPIAWRVDPIYQQLFFMDQEPLLAEGVAQAWRRVVGGMQARLADALRAGAPGTVASTIAASSSDAAPSAAPLPATAASASGGDLLLARLAGLLFPTTDFRHVVVSSMLLWAGQLLSQAPIVNETDVARALLVSGVVVDITREGRRFVPELFGFLASLLSILGGSAGPDASTAGLSLPVPSPNLRLLHRGSAVPAAPWFLKLAASAPKAAAAFRIPASIATESPTGVTRSELCAACIVTAAHLAVAAAEVLVPPGFMEASEQDRQRYAEAAVAPLGDAAKSLGSRSAGAGSGSGAAASATPAAAHSHGAGVSMLAAHPNTLPVASAPELLDPILNGLAMVLAQLTPAPAPVKGLTSAAPASALVTEVTAAVKHLMALRDAVVAVRQPLRLHDQARAPPSIRTFAPLLEEVTARPGGASSAPGKRVGSSNAEAAAAEAREELRKLQRAAKRERRGAARELRHDRAFIVRQLDAAKAGREAERDATYRGLMAQLEQQQASHKQQVRLS
jgi:hypothetical protein